MKIKFLLLMALGFVPQLANADQVVGNGGDIVLCPSSVYMLDLYEGETRWGLEINFGARQKNRGLCLAAPRRYRCVVLFDRRCLCRNLCTSVRKSNRDAINC